MLGRPKIVKEGKNMAVYMDSELLIQIQNEAQKQGLSPSQLVRKIIVTHFQNNK